MSSGKQELWSPAQVYTQAGGMLGGVISSFSKRVMGKTWQHKFLVLEKSYLHIKAGEGSYHPESSIVRTQIDSIKAVETENGPGISLRAKGTAYDFAFDTAALRDQWFDRLSIHAKHRSPRPSRRDHSNDASTDTHAHGNDNDGHDIDDDDDNDDYRSRSSNDSQSKPHYAYTGQQLSPQLPPPQQAGEGGPVDRVPSYNTAVSQMQQERGIYPALGSASMQTPAPTATAPRTSTSSQPPSYSEVDNQTKSL
ncbi:hypothetical protein PTSG_13263 [Salpingoeca rosetta]|uniref:PH domain-containing protein n=1 Tax=Salpingoeca rosetta (strain ATCC 50818 / BSB-021) TaxID=946362 RepID=F2UL25_SALR5|nr:uncharacterized protein PTSG_13263 [Salpingoeca rosetta]EGD77824.1 hypothetical protein PTSG_13263 [Salpingoeca rosetta]|eukprot:XP_004990300.1 hypothetical protein PTSG_13263 [Salpingoeca rosetta]